MTVTVPPPPPTAWGIVPPPPVTVQTPSVSWEPTPAPQGFVAPLIVPQVVYDIETYPNFFCLHAEEMESNTSVSFEISTRRNDLIAFLAWIEDLKRRGVEMVGFNNLGFDYPVIHDIITNPQCRTPAAIYAKAMSIINSQRGDNRFGSIIWDADRVVKQLDLFKVHHFDNVAKSTGLKALQFAMRSDSVEDLPFPVGVVLTPEQMDIVLRYCAHDVTETKQFAIHSKESIDLRRDLTRKYNRDFMNHNDTKIGKDYFIMQLGEEVCFTRETGRRQPRQTPRASIALGDVVLPYVRFNHPEFNRVLDWIRNRVITETKGVIEDLSCTINDFTFVFGTGGIHGSLDSVIIEEDDEHSIWDWDVSSYYPNLSIKNRFYPEHLGERFCVEYDAMYHERTKYDKKSTESKTYKLGLNGTYGDSNNKYSPFYDPKYTMSITINGQLLLCMLAEQLMNVPGLRLLQINTDGLTIRLPRAYEWFMHEITKWWMNLTKLELESVQYRKMCIRDVNNYIAISTKGKVKLKGAYVYGHSGSKDDNKRGWHQDQSALIVPYAAVMAMTKGHDVEETIRTHSDKFDFMCRAKAPRGSKLLLGQRETQNTIRYYVSTDGDHLTKMSPPVVGANEGWYKRKNTVSQADYDAWHAANGNVWNKNIHTGNKSVYDTRIMQIEAGWRVTECNVASQFSWKNVEYQWYINEARKLVIDRR